jgi:antitoxin YefM
VAAELWRGLCPARAQPRRDSEAAQKGIYDERVGNCGYDKSDRPMTRHVPYDEFARRLREYLSEAESDALYIDGKDRVVLSVQKYEGLLETLRILSNPAAAKDLRDAIAEADAGSFVEHELIDE